MAEGIELAKAYVQIVPTTKDIQGELDSALSSAGEKAGKSGGSGIVKGIGGAVGGIAKVAAAGITAVTSGMAAFGVSSVNAGKEFDSAMSQVAATMGNVDDMNDADLSDLRKNAKLLRVAFDETTSATELSAMTLRAFAQKEGSETAFSATEAAEALNYMALAGYDANKSMKMLPTVLNLAAAGGIKLGYASDMVTDTQSALGLSMEETETMVNQMAKASSKSNTSVAQLGEAMLKIGATARNVNGGTKELSTVLGIMADNGIKGTEAGTHLRNIMLSLTPSSEDAAEAMKRIGLQAYNSKGEMRPLNEVFLDLQKGLDGMSTKEKQNILGAIFNKTDLASVNALLGTTNERWNELGSAIGESDGAAKKMAATQLDNLAGDMTLFQSALEGAKIAVSDNLTPTLREFVQFGADGLSQITQAFKEGGLSGAVNAFSEIVTKGVQMIIEMLPGLLEAGTQIFGAIMDGIMAALPSLVSALPTLLAAFIDLTLSITNGIIEALPMMVTTLVEALPVLIPQLINGAVALFVALMENYNEIIVPLIDALPDILKAIVDGLFNNLPLLLEAVIGLIGAIVENLPAFMEAIWEAIVHIWDTWIEPIVKTIGEFFSGLWEDIKGVFSVVGQWFDENVIQPVVGFFRDLWETVAGFFTSLWNDIVNAYHTVIDPWIEIFKRAFLILDTEVIQPVKKFFTDLWEDIKGIFTQVATWFDTNVIQPLVNVFGPIWEKISGGAKEAWEGIKGVFSSVTEWFREKFSAAWQAVKNVFSAGGRIFENIKEGISSVFKTVVNAIIRGINKVVAFPFNAINGFLDTLRSISILGIKPFSWIGSIGVPQIPELAEGGVLTSPRLILAGEAGDEAIVPLERNTEWIRMVADELNGSNDDELLRTVEALSAKLDNIQIVLDSGKVVGGISTRMDGALGNNGLLQGRRVALA